jgi:hypothetical protein
MLNFIQREDALKILNTRKDRSKIQILLNWCFTILQVQKTEFDAIYKAFFDPTQLHAEGIRLKVRPSLLLYLIYY